MDSFHRDAMVDKQRKQVRRARSIVGGIWVKKVMDIWGYHLYSYAG